MARDETTVKAPRKVVDHVVLLWMKDEVTEKQEQPACDQEDSAGPCARGCEGQGWLRTGILDMGLGTEMGTGKGDGGWT
uniref:Uncharacterized protein n=1 Tax=Physcomitrium patens TaxID=3218 RepID=A0A2K1I9Z4_PHYPA|nr:hypothetical protein PHYPA_031140 [Physcomitrium patens]